MSTPDADKAMADAEWRAVFNGILTAATRDGEVAALRVWMVGCRSLPQVRAFVHRLARWSNSLSARWNPRNRVFISDADAEAVATARRSFIVDGGLAFKLGAAPTDVEQCERVAEEFLSATIRTSLVFSKHNLLTTPPFAKLDLIYCAHLGAEPAKAIPVLHYALKDAGRLVLEDDDATPPPELFEPLGRRRFRRRVGTDSDLLKLPTFLPFIRTQNPRLFAPPPAAARLPQEVPPQAAGSKRRASPRAERLDAAAEARAADDLRASQVELMAAYAELQAAHEELQIGDQELSIRNDELLRVNERLQGNFVDLEKSHDAVLNLLRNSDAATVVLNDALRIEYFNHHAGPLFNLIAPDVGRPLADLKWNIDDDSLLSECVLVMHDLQSRRSEVQSRDGRSFLRTIAAYRTRDQRITGVTVICSDVTPLREAGKRRAVLAAVLLNSRDAVIALNPDGTVMTWNDRAEKFFRLDAGDMADAELPKILDGFEIGRSVAAQKASSGNLGRNLLERLRRNERIDDLEVRGQGPDGEPQILLLTASPVQLDGGEVIAYSLLARDVTKERSLENAVLQAAVAEQQRIGQELHDGIGQELTAMAIQIHTLIEALGAGHPEAKLAKKIGHDARRTLNQVRTLSKGLIPIEVDGRGLVPALEALAHHLQDRTPCKIQMSSDPTVAMDDNIAATHLYRIAQEAITNALKHSRARSIDVSLRSSDDRIVLQVADDGIGIDVMNRVNGVGLSVMRYRAAAIGAALQIERGRERGTTVICTLPVDAAATETNGAATLQRHPS